ncbi:hypothetical protein PVAP13_2KG516205 [Panicum virgatum]|uniref:Secreted protein n=1 Tax=Panicum virgatum TaxID=38727 RepID=A0A8T0WLB1_PANVG|nr:hypothetical protein PVAP13_2KG516205 [Panicum virgatum]
MCSKRKLYIVVCPLLWTFKHCVTDYIYSILCSTSTCDHCSCDQLQFVLSQASSETCEASTFLYIQMIAEKDERSCLSSLPVRS